MTNKVNQALAWSVVPLPSAWCRGADIGGECHANRNARAFYFIWCLKQNF